MAQFLEGIATGVVSTILASISAAAILARYFKSHPEKLYSTFIRRSK